MTVGEGVGEASVHLGVDAQTPGGLLIAIPAERHTQLMAALRERGVTGITIGQITGPSTGHIEVAATAEYVINEEVAMSTGTTERHAESCCAGEGGGASSDTARAFGAFMRAAAAGGALDERTKELITFGLVVLSRCAPCLQAHLKKAREMGISDAELEEAAWCAIAMGGAPVKMFFEEGMKESKESKCC